MDKCRPSATGAVELCTLVYNSTMYVVTQFIIGYREVCHSVDMSADKHELSSSTNLRQINYTCSLSPVELFLHHRWQVRIVLLSLSSVPMFVVSLVCVIALYLWIVDNGAAIKLHSDNKNGDASSLTLLLRRYESSVMWIVFPTVLRGVSMYHWLLQIA